MKTFISILTVHGKQLVGGVVQRGLDANTTPPEGFVAYDGEVQSGWLWDGTKASPPSATPPPPPPFVAAPGDPLIAALYAEAERRANEAVDDSASKKYLSWKYDPASSAARKQKIAEIEAWADLLWQAYRDAKAKVLAGDRGVQLPPVDQFPKVPWTFWDVAGA